MEKSPIVIAVFCYKRANKLRECINALLKNPECPQLDIVFFSDGYRNEQDRPGVLATREYINSITGFKSVIKQFRDQNVRTGANFREGLRYLSENYKEFIVVEDDLIVSPNYIRFLLDALKAYRHHPKIFCVTGFVYPVKAGNYPYDSIIYQRFCSYGWAGWSDRFENVIWDEHKLREMMDTSKGFRQRLNAEGHDLSRMLNKQLDGRISTWDVQLQVHIAENGLKVVYPALSKVTNIGFDEESTNTFGVNWMVTPLDPGHKREFVFCPPSHIVPSLQAQIKRPFSLPELVKRKLINTMIKVTGSVKKA